MNDQLERLRTRDVRAERFPVSDDLGSGTPAGRWRLSVLGWPLLIVAAVVAANFPALVGIVDVNPLGPLGRTAVDLHPGYLPGWYYLDKEIGYTAQALGHLSAMDWLHGIVPWWNPFEGVGSPLVGEMNAAAFFPPTLLLALPQGQLYFHMLLEVTAGLGTFLLLRELGFGRPIAALGGALFALNGTFAWFQHAPVNPICFLPFTLYAIERLFRRSAPDHTAWIILGTALALSVYGGFPETTYLDGLFALGWFVLRLAMHPRSGRPRFLGQVALGAAVGALLTAPVAAAFLGYLPSANLGGHGAASYATAAVPGFGVSMLGLPYLWGPIMGIAPKSVLVHATWNTVGGYVTAPVLAMGLVGAVKGRRDAVLRAALAVAFVVLVLWTFQVSFVGSAFNHLLPLATHLKVFRYVETSFEMAVVVLACYGVEAVAHRTGRSVRPALVVGGVGALVALAVDLEVASQLVRLLYGSVPGYRPWPFVMTIWAAGMAVLVTVVALLPSRRDEPGHRRPMLPREGARKAAAAAVGGLLVVDAVVMFGIPQLSAPRSETIDTGPARYLAAHLKNGRFFSLDAYLPNYGSYFRIASVDSNDLPIPTLWADYVPAHVAPGSMAKYFGSYDQEPRLLPRLPAYEALDVRYIMLASSDDFFGTGTDLKGGVTRVYRDSLATIYKLPHPQNFFSVTSGSCHLDARGIATVTATCARPSTLLRRELYMPGWHATAAGRPLAIHEAVGLFQSVRLPAGTTTVHFGYAPPHESLALWLLLLGIVIAVGVPPGTWLLRRRHGPPSEGVPPGDAVAAL